MIPLSGLKGLPADVVCVSGEKWPTGLEEANDGKIQPRDRGRIEAAHGNAGR